MKISSCQVSKSGRLSLPAAFRKVLALEHGGRVVVELDEEEVRILTQQQAIARAQARYRRALDGRPGISVHEFVAERIARPSARKPNTSARRPGASEPGRP